MIGLQHTRLEAHLYLSRAYYFLVKRGEGMHVPCAYGTLGMKFSCLSGKHAMITEVKVL